MLGSREVLVGRKRRQCRDRSGLQEEEPVIGDGPLHVLRPSENASAGPAELE
jgi:hypothetical protein